MPLTTGPIHGRTTRVLFQGRDLSLSLRESSLQLNGDTVEVTAFANSIKQYLSGLPEGRVTVNGFYDAGTDGAFHIFMQRFVRGSTGTIVIENQGHGPMGQSTVITGLITNIQLTNQVADVIAMNMEVMVTGEVYVCRNLFNAGTQQLLNGSVSYEMQMSTALETPYSTYRQVTDAAITSSSGTLTSATAVFTSADVGKTVAVAGAGVAGAALIATITVFTNATTVTVSPTAGTTVTGAVANIGTGYSGMLYWQTYNPHTAARTFSLYNNHISPADTGPPVGDTLVSASVAASGFANGVVGSGLVPWTIKDYVKVASSAIGSGQKASTFYVGVVDTSESLLNL